MPSINDGCAGAIAGILHDVAMVPSSALANRACLIGNSDLSVLFKDAKTMGVSGLYRSYIPTVISRAPLQFVTWGSNGYMDRNLPFGSFNGHIADLGSSAIAGVIHAISTVGVPVSAWRGES